MKKMSNMAHMGSQALSPSFICQLAWSCHKKIKTEVENPHSTCTKLLDLGLILASHLRILKTADLREKKFIFLLKQKMAHLQINGWVGQEPL